MDITNASYSPNKPLQSFNNSNNGNGSVNTVTYTAFTAKPNAGSVEH